MSRTSLEELLDRWMNDSDFRREFSADPEGAVHGVGAILTDEEFASLHAITRGRPGEELERRISRS